VLGFQRMKAMTKHRSHSAAFKRQVAQEFIAGETLHGLSQRHDISRQLIQICQRAPKFPQKWAVKIPWFGGVVLGW
jgi:hypothetical protein